MVFAMGPMGVDEINPPPQSIKETFGCWWWLYLFILVGCMVGEAVAQDIFGVLFFVLLSFIVWYMVKDDYKGMSQYCVFMFAFLCMIQFIFDAVLLAVSAGGRRTQRVETKPISDTKMSYTTVIETRPFFDDSAGFVYNAQSWMMIISCVVMFLGAILAYRTYNAWPQGLFADDEYLDEPIYPGDAERRQELQAGRAQAPQDTPYQQRPQGGGGQYGAAQQQQQQQQQQRPAPGAAPPGGGNAGRRQPGTGPGGFRVFEGEGQRLGSNDNDDDRRR